MKIGVPKEAQPDERRVALVPDNVARLVRTGLEVLVEAGAGDASFFPDSGYQEAGAKIVSDAATLYKEADVVVKVGPPTDRNGVDEVDLLHEGSVLIGLLNPLGDPALAQKLASRNITSFSMELIPRITRAQSMDALSSQANLAGYKAVILAANALPKFFPMLMTAAGVIPPAKVLVIGAGVAGLQAIATARRLGAVVEAFDIRPAAKEEVQSLGAKFVEVALEEETAAEGGYAKEVSEEAKRREQEVLNEHIAASNVVITTALVPGRRAPVLVTAEAVNGMAPGSVIVDLAAEQGGNCELTEAGKDVVHNGVKIIGPVNLPSSVSVHASQLYSRNIFSLLQLLTKDNNLNLDFEDSIINATCLTHEGTIRPERVRDALAVLKG